jgi:hypothetical protein
MYKVEICHMNVQVKFKFVYGPKLLTELSLLNLEKNTKFSVSTLLTFVQTSLY